MIQKDVSCELISCLKVFFILYLYLAIIYKLNFLLLHKLGFFFYKTRILIMNFSLSHILCEGSLRNINNNPTRCFNCLPVIKK